MLHPLIATVRSFIDFPDAEADHFLSLFSRKKYKRGAMMLEEGRVAHEVFFIMKGAARQFFLMKKGWSAPAIYHWNMSSLLIWKAFPGNHGRHHPSLRLNLLNAWLFPVQTLWLR
ncbi:hypothetical protein A8C56_07140 [Niabella ginsenosidivorans]|uniref:Cyclic nucleotide-binding domain-containing protein n=1 Tax=Niabella ginsenosidivorans TaxID=1176587 RepID=A0A1A9I2H7_9BACT|nr:hypothetical protein A8C56_07140 [Niabella ginsenosidivorans]